MDVSRPIVIHRNGVRVKSFYRIGKAWAFMKRTHDEGFNVPVEATIRNNPKKFSYSPSLYINFQDWALS